MSTAPAEADLRLPRWQHQATGAARRAARLARQAARRLSGRPHPLPDFVVIGAQRCGTTSLFNDLVTHPDVVAPLGKELHHFTLHHRRSLEQYRACFPVLRPGQQTFEATPYYLFHPHVPARMAAALPQARFVVMLRDPVERAFSHYLHTKRTGQEPLELREALEAEPARMELAARHGLDSAVAHRELREHSYLSRGRYAEQLRRWYEHVDPERVLVLRTEDVAADPEGEFGRLTAFLGLRPWAPGSFSRHTRRGSRQELPADLRGWMRQQVQADVDDLLTLTGWERGWW